MLFKENIKFCIDNSEKAEKEFKKFVERSVKNKISKNVFNIDLSMLGGSLSSKEPRVFFIDKYTKEFCENSIQSRKMIEKFFKSMSITINEEIQSVISDEEIFQTRNSIIHSMDVDFHNVYIRISRREERMLEYVKNLEKISQYAIQEIGKIKINKK